MATMKDVARTAGVSIATVSATLSGAAYVSPELKERVLAAVEDLGYTPNSAASGLKRGRSSLLGLIVPDITNPFFTEFVHCVQRDARAAGWTVMLAASDQDVATEAGLVRMMRAHQAAGTILCATGSADDVTRLSALAGPMRLVLVDNAPEGETDTVVFDNRRAADLATRHILSFGHRAVATVAGPQHQVPGRERLEGFLATMAAAGLDVGDAFVRHGEFRQEEAYDACRDLLSGPGAPTALFVANNHMLVGVMRAIADMGLSVPADVSVASIDDFPWAVAFTPALTVVRQPIAAMARAALDGLVARIEGANATPCRTVAAPELVVRRSCGPPRAGR